MTSRFYLDTAMLEKHKACEPALRWFKQHYGRRTLVTREFLEAARQHDASYLWWLFHRVFPLPASPHPASLVRARKVYMSTPLNSVEEQLALESYGQATIDAILNAPLLKER